MTTVEPCDGCGRKVSSIKRAYRGKRYCAACYKRIFKRAMCQECGNFARLPMNKPKAICRECERKRPCVRCGRSGRPISKVTVYGNVCNSCALYFNEPKPCEQCGKMSLRLTKVSRLQLDVRVCEQCATQDYSSCPACNRHRLLYKAPDGRKLCKKCLTLGEVDCPECGQTMPAGRGSQCQQCYLKSLLKKRVEIDMAAFTKPIMAKHFEAFGEWLGGHAGYHNAVHSIHRYLNFFKEIEKRWGDIPAYEELVTHFGPQGLRRVLRVKRWMESCGLIYLDEGSKLWESESRQIDVLLRQLPGDGSAQRLLKGYFEKLQERLATGRTSLRSVRLALAPAVALLHEANVQNHIPPNQNVLDRFLSKKPGQRAAISGFVGYLRKSCGIDIVLPSAHDKKMLKLQRRRLEKDMLEQLGGNFDEKTPERWLVGALAYFHGLPLSTARKVKEEALRRLDDGSFIVCWEGKEYWLPNMGDALKE